MVISKYASIKELDFVIATYQDPDTITSMDRWLMYTEDEHGKPVNVILRK